MPRWRATMRGLLISSLALGLTLASTAPPASAATVLAQDGFARTATNGLGRADVGGAWTISGTASRFAVSGGAARISTAPNVTTAAYLTAVSARDVDATASFALSTLPTGGSDYEKLLVRRAGGSDYSALVLVSATSGVTVGLLAGGTTLQTVKPAGVVAAAGAAIRVRVQAIGASPTTLRARAWLASSTEPTAWQLTASDSTAGLQVAGGVGVRSYRTAATTTGGRTDVDDLLVTDATPAPINTPPTASFTATTTGLTAALDASASTDPDGAIAGYSWAFGDGTTGTGSTTTHAYAVDGTYPVSLTVTDAAGATATTTRSVTVTSRPTQSHWLADVSAAVSGAEAVIDAGATSARPAIVLDIDNTAMQSYYQSKTATPQILALEQRAVAAGYTVLVATGRSADAGYTAAALTNAGYQVASLCFRDPTSPSIQASKIACRAAWAAEGYSIVANFGNHLSDLDGGNSGQTYLLPNYGFLD